MQLEGTHRFSQALAPAWSALRHGVCRFGDAYRATVRTANKKAVQAAVALAATAACTAVFFQFYAVGYGVYVGDRFVALSHNQSAIEAAFQDARTQAAAFDASLPAELRLVPQIRTKRSVRSDAALTRALLLASPDLSQGYRVVADGEVLFIAASRRDAEIAIDEYMSVNDLAGNGYLTRDLVIEEDCARTDTISDLDACVDALLACDSISVMSTINEEMSEPIPFQTEELPDDTLYIGETVTVSSGEAGEKLVEKRLTYENKALVAEQVLSEAIISEPVPAKIRIGTKPRNLLEAGLTRPISGGRVSSSFGARWGRQHRGIDLATPTGTPVVAAGSGTVITAGYLASYGNFVQIDHGGGIVTGYAHLDQILVESGQTVGAGALIAKSGNTGNSTGPHLHFEIIQNGTHINPAPYLP